MKKKITALFLVLTMCFLYSTTSSASSADDSNTDSSKSETSYVDTILSSYHERMADINLRTDITDVKKGQLKATLRDARAQALIDAGYEVFRINPNNFNSAKTELNTDLSKIGLDPSHSYLVILSAENVINGSPSSSFTYTYNGTSYLMRYFTVTADDDEADPRYAQASTYDVLDSNVLSVIRNCLDTAISAYISEIWAPLGTVASICGLSISDFGENSRSTMTFNAGTNWTRVYTQVYSTYDQAWSFCSSVEYARSTSYMSGMYYDKNLNSMEPVPRDKSFEETDSPNYYDYTWRKTQAAIAFSSGSPCRYDLTGDDEFYYGDRLIITHRENF